MKTGKFIVSVLIPLAIGFLGSLLTFTSIDTWYAGLNKPSFNPPNWVFGPVWTTLYILMGISLFIVWKNGINKSNRLAISIFFVQLMLNLFWSFLFFGLQSPFWGLIEIVILWIFILLNILFFSKISRTAALLLIPYIIWVTFAAFLNLNVWLLN